MVGRNRQESLNVELPDPETLTATALLFMASGGFSIASPQLERFSQEIRSDAATLEKIALISQQLSFDDFIKLGKGSLSTEQKIFLLMTLYDSIASDANGAEAELFKKFLTAFETSVENIDAHLNVIDVKHSLWRQP